jgi:Raf kinase inhibitor-like YbhB/YbcL family protein
VPTPRSRTRWRATTACAAALLLAVGCSRDGRTLAPAGPDQTLSIVTTTTTPVVDTVEFAVHAPWEEGTNVPVDATCDGAGRPPVVTWAGVPAGAVELVLVLSDIDAANRVHWLVAGIDPVLATSVTPDAVPPGAVVGMNTAGTVGYEPVCPPPGEPFHRYTLDLYALGSPSGITPTMTAVDAVGAVLPLALGTTSTTGTYQR